MSLVYFISFENYAFTSWVLWCIIIRVCNDLPAPYIRRVSRKSCNCWVLAGSLLLTAASAGSCWWPNDRSFDDRKDSAAAVESERVPVASICDSCAKAPHPDDDRFWLVVISVACASLRTRHIACQSCDMPSAADNTRDMAPAVRVVPSRPSALCNWPLPLHCCYTNTDD